jgi:hypothetical protein
VTGIARTRLDRGELSAGAYKVILGRARNPETPLMSIRTRCRTDVTRPRWGMSELWWALRGSTAMDKKSKPSLIRRGQGWRGPNPETGRNEAAIVFNPLIPAVEMRFEFTGPEIIVTDETLNSRAWEFLSDAMK